MLLTKPTAGLCLGIVRKINYYVSDGTLNHTHSLN